MREIPIQTPLAHFTPAVHIASTLGPCSSFIQFSRKTPPYLPVFSMYKIGFVWLLFLVYLCFHFLPFSEMARYRQKTCFKRLLTKTYQLNNKIAKDRNALISMTTYMCQTFKCCLCTIVRRPRFLRINYCIKAILAAREGIK